MLDTVVNRALSAALVALLLSSCAGPALQNQSMLRGFNAMQHENMAWDNPQASRSIKQLAVLGSNAVVFISFLEQDSSSSIEVRRSQAVNLSQLKTAFGYAREAGLKIILKPQMLVRGSWAGAIEHDDSEKWQVWFESYSREIVELARFASEHGVQAFVIGTELSKSVNHVNWPGLIKRVRNVYSGKLTYAAHNIEGLMAFPHWNKLDAVSLTMYPTLGASGDEQEMQQKVDAVVARLQTATTNLKRDLWVLEIGMPSAKGASEKPWEWQHLKHAAVDLDLQKKALDIWLKSLDQPWVDGVFIWAWYSDFRSGGLNNADYTPQNKPAEYIIRRYWKS